MTDLDDLERLSRRCDATWLALLIADTRIAQIEAEKAHKRAMGELHQWLERQTRRTLKAFEGGRVESAPSAALVTDHTSKYPPR